MKYLVLIAVLLCSKLSLAGAGVASAHPIATEAAIEIFESGGNAFDAAVALTACLAVVEPYSSGLGGGGFYLLYIKKEDRYVFVDARERAPMAAHRDMYLDDDGNIIPGASIDGALSAGIPGIPAALGHLSRKYGKLGLAQLLAPAIEAAGKGFAVDKALARMAGFRRDALHRFTDSRRIFLSAGEAPAVGDLLVQEDLAATLEAIAETGPEAFYKGAIAGKLVKAVQGEGGIWTRSDLADYRIVEREPIVWTSGFGTLIGAPPPSSGGIALAQIFGQLDSLGLLGSFDAANPRHLHYLIESMRRAYRDRALYLGDPDFADIPVARLASPEYAAGLAASIHSRKASSSLWFDSSPIEAESPHTTHFSVYDRDGNIVSATLSINYPFGSAMVAAGTGVLLNDEMDDFSSKPGTQNVYGLIGSTANAIEPGKRMLSSMSPTILRLPGRTVVIGTPGGSRIITMVAQGALSAIAGEDARAIVDKPRLHHQFVPDEVYAEPDLLSEKLRSQLEAMGHSLSVGERQWGNMQLVVVDDEGAADAASDSRGVGAARTIKAD